MTKPAWMTGCLLALFLAWPGTALSQKASPEALAAAKELIIATNAADQFKTLGPLLMQELKPAIVQNRPQVERAYDELMPKMLEGMNSELGAIMEATAIIYANNFSVEEMREVAAFYSRPVGQKLLQKMPVVMQQSMQMGRKFGESLARDLDEKMRGELRKRGHNI